MTTVLLTVLGLVIATAVAAIGSMSHTLRDHTHRIDVLELRLKERKRPTPAPAPDPEPQLDPVTEPIPIGPDTQPIPQAIDHWHERESARQERETARLEDKIAAIRERTEKRQQKAQT